MFSKNAIIGSLAVVTVVAILAVIDGVTAGSMKGKC